MFIVSFARDDDRASAGRTRARKKVQCREIMAQTTEGLEKVFRAHRRALLGTLTRVFGAKNLDLVETVVQDAFLKAHETWAIEGVPDNPRCWLLKVARNKLLDQIRYRETYDKKQPELVEFANALG